MLQVDFSSLCDYSWCKRLYYYRHVRDLVPKAPSSKIALNFGTAVHEALDAWARQQHSLDAALAAFDVSWQQRGDVLPTTGRNRIVAGALLHAWHRKHSDDEAPLYVEIGASIDIDSDVLLYGRIDKVCTIIEGTGPIDNKTTSTLTWLPQPRLNWQLIGYAHMVAALTDIQPTIVGIDGLVCKSLWKKHLPKDFIVELDNIEEAYIGPPIEELSLNYDDCIVRRTALIQQSDRDMWWAWLTDAVNGIRERTGLSAQHWPGNAPTACHRYNGRCDYETLCFAPTTETMERLVEGLYVEEPWHPYE